MKIKYEPYRMSRQITIQELVSADYIQGLHPFMMDHSHQQAWELCACLEGQLQVMKGSKVIPLDAGNLMLIQPGIHHDIASEDRKLAAFIVSFTCSGEDLRPLQETVLPFQDEQNALFRNLVRELKASFVQDEDALHLYHFLPAEHSPMGAEQLICGYLEQIIILLFRSITMNQGQVVSKGSFKEALQSYLAEQVSTYIDEHLGQHLTVEALAGHFHYSRTHLSISYKAATGLSVGEYITFARISKAKILLLEQEKSVAQISEELGLATPQYFSYKFTQEVGVAPSRYVASVCSREPTSLL